MCIGVVYIHVTLSLGSVNVGVVCVHVTLSPGTVYIGVVYVHVTPAGQPCDKANGKPVYMRPCLKLKQNPRLIGAWSPPLQIAL